MEMPTNEKGLRTFARYLPYITILALAWFNYQQYKDAREDHKANIGEQKERTVFWRDAFLTTTTAYQKAFGYDIPKRGNTGTDSVNDTRKQ